MHHPHKVWVDTTYVAGHAMPGAPSTQFGMGHHIHHHYHHKQAGGILPALAPLVIGAYHVLDKVKPFKRLDGALEGLHSSNPIIKGIRHVTNFLSNAGIGEKHHHHKKKKTEWWG